VFSGLMMNTWIAASVVAVIAGVTGFFAVLRGQSFAAHAIPNGAFAGAAGAGLLGFNVIWGLAVFAVGGAVGIAALGRRARQDVITALVLVLMLGLGALFLSFSTEYAEVTYSLLFGEVFGVSQDVLLPIAALGIASVAIIALIYRPLLLASAMPEVADARGVSTRRMELCFLLVMALATSMTVPVVGALLMFALMIGPAAAARSFTKRPGYAIALAIAIALVTVWVGIAASYHTNWPLGFYVGVIAAGFFLVGQGWAALRRRRSAPRQAPVLSPVSLSLDRTVPSATPEPAAVTHGESPPPVRLNGG
jgi:zinc/manganese transport system permease protein